MSTQESTDKSKKEMDRRFASVYSKLPVENKNVIMGLMTGMVLQEQMEKSSGKELEETGKAG